MALQEEIQEAEDTAIQANVAKKEVRLLEPLHTLKLLGT